MIDERQFALIQKLLDTQKEMLDVLGALAESQMLLTEALTPQIINAYVEEDEEPGPTIQ